MPGIGEIKRGRDLGKAGNIARSAKYIWQACVGCGIKRWVRFEKGQPVTRMCRLCGMKLARMVAEKELATGIMQKKLSKAHKGKCMGENHHNWNGGRKSDSANGYIDILLRPDDYCFPMAFAGGYAKEHRIVMARHLGRCLLDSEVVHHKNGIGTDNRIENLGLFSSQNEHMKCHHELRTIMK